MMILICIFSVKPSLLLKQQIITNNYIIICLLNILIFIMVNARSSNDSGSVIYSKFSLNRKEYHEFARSEFVLASYRIEFNRDLNTPPCSDFYKFACGEFTHEKVIPRDQLMISSMKEVMNEHQNNLRILLKQINIATHPRSFTFAQRFYDQCVELESKNQNQFGMVLHLFNSHGGWPVLRGESDGTWQKQNFGWLALICDTYKNGFPAHYLFRLSIEIDPTKFDTYIFVIDQPKLEFPKEIFDKYTESPHELNQYYSYMLDVTLRFGANKEKALNHLSQILSFEYMLSNITLSDENILNVHDRKARYSLVELMELTPNINWHYILNNYVNEDTTIGYDEIVIVKSLQYLIDLDKILKTVRSEPLANYLMWKIVAQSVPFLNDDLKKRTFAYREIFTGPIKRKPLWDECVDVTKQYFPGVINALFSTNNITRTEKNATIEIINAIKNSLAHNILASMIGNTINMLLVEKIQHLTYNFGFPLNQFDYYKLLDYYNVPVYSANYYESMLLISRRHREFYVGKFKDKHMAYDDWISRVNMPLYEASYDHKQNRINLGVGNLNSLNINTNLPYYVRFAGIGVLVGRLIVQMFDSTGVQFDQDGVLHNWCADNCENYFMKESECIANQYDNFMDFFQAKNIGEKTKHLNIQDLHGVNIAYVAYDKWLYEYGEEVTLPSMNYSSKQMFWIWYANTLCSHYDVTGYDHLVQTGIDIDPRYRVNGPLSNSYAFPIDFNCKLKNTMYMREKCRV